MSHNFYTVGTYNKIFSFDHDEKMVDQRIDQKTFFTSPMAIDLCKFDLYESFHNLFFKDLNELLAKNIEMLLRDENVPIDQKLLNAFAAVDFQDEYSSDQDYDDNINSLIQFLMNFLGEKLLNIDEYESFNAKKNVLEIKFKDFKSEKLKSNFQQTTKFYLKKVNIVFNFQHKKTPLFLKNTETSIDLCVQGFVEENYLKYNFVYKTLSGNEIFYVPKMIISEMPQKGYKTLDFIRKIENEIDVDTKNNDFGINYRKAKNQKFKFQKFVENAEQSDGQIEGIVEIGKAKFSEKVKILYNPKFIVLIHEETGKGIKFIVPEERYKKYFSGKSGRPFIFFDN